MESATLIVDAEGTLLLRGRLDPISVAALVEQGRQYIGAQAGTRVQIDLQGVTHADSTGVALLISWLRHAVLQCKELSFTHVPSQLTAIIQVSGLSHILALVS